MISHQPPWFVGSFGTLQAENSQQPPAVLFSPWWIHSKVGLQKTMDFGALQKTRHLRPGVFFFTPSEWHPFFKGMFSPKVSEFGTWKYEGLFASNDDFPLQFMVIFSGCILIVPGYIRVCYSNTNSKNQSWNMIFVFHTSNLPISTRPIFQVQVAVASRFAWRCETREKKKKPEVSTKRVFALKKMVAEEDDLFPLWGNLGLPSLKTNGCPLTINGWKMYSLLN